MSQRSGCLGGGLFAVCAVVAALAYTIAFGDQHTGGLYKGYVGAIALFLAGLPWSLVLVQGSLGLSESAANTLLYLFPILNVVVTGWIAFGSRSAPADDGQ